MTAALKAEFRKLLTVRSTYIIFIIGIILVIFLAGFITSYKADARVFLSPGYFSSQIFSAIGFVAILPAIVALLLLAHEYRYNTIMYSLTSAKSRLVLWSAKLLIAMLFTVVFTMFISFLTVLATYIGAELKGYDIAPQTLQYGDLLWRCLFFACSYAALAYVTISLIRNQIGALVVYFIAPSTIEGILQLLLKENSRYLPFTSLGSVVDTAGTFGISPGRAALTASIYLIAGLAIAAYLFVRRDAN